MVTRFAICVIALPLRQSPEAYLKKLTITETIHTKKETHLTYYLLSCKNMKTPITYGLYSLNPRAVCFLNVLLSIKHNK